MNLLGIRQHIADLCFRAGSIKKWADKKGLAHSHIAAIIRGEAAPGNKVLKIIRKRPVVVDKGKEPRYEDITN